MSALRDAKVEKVAEIKEKLQNASSFVLVDYKGLTVAEDTALRSEFRKSGVTYHVYPPYNKELEKGALEYLSTSALLKEDSIIIVEASTETNFDYVEELGFEITKYKKYKTNVHVFLQKK